MKLYKSFLVFSCFLLAISAVPAQGFLKADGQRIVNAKGENVLLRGVGLGGWMLQEGYMLGFYDSAQQHVIRRRLERLTSKAQTDEFYDAWLSNHTTKADIDSLKAWGFNSVRLPMHYALYTLPAEQETSAGNNTWVQKGFALTDSLLSWCKANKMYLILDMHAAPGGQGNDVNISDRDPSKPSLWEDAANREKMIALWKKLAARYANEPWIGAYDIINEPNWGFDDLANDRNGLKEKNNKPLKELLITLTNTIRTVDKNHLIIIEGNGWGNNYNGILNEGLWDHNMALSFHKYWNPNDDASIKHILDYRSKYNVPVWLGESGENSNVWYTQAIDLLEKNNIGWAWWPLKKLGVNNPLQIKSNHNYDKVVAYLSGNSKDGPGESDAYSGLLEMATYSNNKTNMVHYDVIDAMIRQPHDNTAKPFKQNSIGKGTSTIMAVDYDLGKMNIAYHVEDTADNKTPGLLSAGNKGRVYRNDAVDIFKDSSHYDRYYIGSTEAGEWLQYTVKVMGEGNYEVMLEANTIEKDSVALYDGQSLLKKFALTPSKSWSKSAAGFIHLNAGVHSLKLVIENNNINLLSLQFVKK